MCNDVHSEVVQINLHPDSASMYIEQWTYYRLREQSVCNNVHSKVVQINLHTEGTKFSINVHKSMDILQVKRTISV